MTSNTVVPRTCMGSHLVAVVLLLLLISDPYTRLGPFGGQVVWDAELLGAREDWAPVFLSEKD